MIPISDDNPTRLAPIMTVAIIGLCVVVYVWELSLGRYMDVAVAVLGFTPVALLGHRMAVHGFVSPQPIETIFTSMFVHGGLLHLGGNMLYLWIFGNNVEDAMGHIRFVIFYLASGIAAALTFAYMDPASSIPMVGASGAISGVLAAYMLLFPRARVTVIVPLIIIFYPIAMSAFWVVCLWFLLQLVNAWLSGHELSGGVAWWAHVGGFLAGLIMTPFLKSLDFPLFGEPRRRRGPWSR
jgi:membrane associated rhomboid family serine protease